MKKHLLHLRQNTTWDFRIFCHWNTISIWIHMVNISLNQISLTICSCYFHPSIQTLQISLMGFPKEDLPDLSYYSIRICINSPWTSHRDAMRADSSAAFFNQPVIKVRSTSGVGKHPDIWRYFFSLNTSTYFFQQLLLYIRYKVEMLPFQHDIREPFQAAVRHISSTWRCFMVPKCPNKENLPNLCLQHLVIHLSCKHLKTHRWIQLEPNKYIHLQ